MTTIPFTMYRVPIIFVLDELFKRDFDLTNITGMFSVNNENINNGTVCQIDSANQSLYGYDLSSVIKVFVCCTIYWTILYLIALPKAFLKLAYGHVIVLCIIILSVWMNLEALKLLTEKWDSIKENTKDKALWDIVVMVEFLMESQVSEFLFIILRTLVVQYFLSLLLDMISSCFILYDISGAYFLFPVFFIFIPTTQTNLNLLYVMISILPILKWLFLSIYYLTTSLNEFAFMVLISNINDFGVFSTIDREWKRNDLPSVLQLFWIMRVIYQYLYLMPDMKTTSETLQFLLINGCDTFISFSGMVFFFSSVLKFFETCISQVLLIDHLEIKNLNEVFIILFYIMAYQTGLIYLEPEERFTQLCQNAYLLCSLLPLYIHNIIHPLLIYSPYFAQNSFKWTPSALLVCGSLSMFSAKLLVKIWTTDSFNIWLLVVSIFNCQTNIHLLLSLIVYLLNLINCFEFDDYMKYSKIVGTLINFLLDIFYLLACIYIVAFEPFSVVRSWQKLLNAIIISTIFIYYWSNVQVTYYRI